MTLEPLFYIGQMSLGMAQVLIFSHLRLLALDLLPPTAAEGAATPPTLLLRGVTLRTLLRVWGSGFRVQGSGFRVQGSGFRVQGSGFRVQG
jgi:hypothetical protein